MHGLQLNFEFTSQKSAGIQTPTLYQYRHRVILGPMELGNLLSAAFGVGLCQWVGWSPLSGFRPFPTGVRDLRGGGRIIGLSYPHCLIKSKVSHKLPEKPNVPVLVSHIHLTTADTYQRELTPLSSPCSCLAASIKAKQN